MIYMTDGKETLISDEEANLENVKHNGQKMELDMDDLDDVAGGSKSRPPSPYSNQGAIGGSYVADLIWQMREDVFRQ
jgi:hypothetical protein